VPDLYPLRVAGFDHNDNILWESVGLAEHGALRFHIPEDCRQHTETVMVELDPAAVTSVYSTGPDQPSFTGRVLDELSRASASRQGPVG
jgi:hypothetical protein